MQFSLIFQPTYINKDGILIPNFCDRLIFKEKEVSNKLHWKLKFLLTEFSKTPLEKKKIYSKLILCLNQFNNVDSKCATETRKNKWMSM